MAGFQMIGDYKIIDGDEVQLKVVGFLSQSDGFSESMWVTVVDGDDHEGIGLINNIPMGSDFEFGDVVSYHEGSDEHKPKFKAKLNLDPPVGKPSGVSI